MKEISAKKNLFIAILDSLKSGEFKSLISLLRNPGSMIFIQAFDIKCKSILGYIIDHRESLIHDFADDLTEEQEYKLALLDLSIAVYLEASAGFCLMSRDNNVHISLSDALHQHFNKIFQSVCRDVPKDKQSTYDYKSKMPEYYTLANKFIILNQVDNPYSTSFTRTIMSNVRKKYSPLIAAPIFSTDLNYDELCYWYLTCIFHMDHMLVGKFKKTAVTIFYEYIKSLDRLNERVQNLASVIAKNRELIEKNNLGSRPEIKYLLDIADYNNISHEDAWVDAELLYVTPRPKKKKKQKKKKGLEKKPVKKSETSQPHTPSIEPLKSAPMLEQKISIKDLISSFDKDLQGNDFTVICKTLLKAAHVFKEITADKFFISACEDLSKIYQLVDLELPKKSSVDVECYTPIYMQWNKWIKAVILRTEQYFLTKSKFTTAKKKVLAFINEIIKYIHLDLLDYKQLIFDFYKDHLSKSAYFIIYGSFVTNRLQSAFQQTAIPFNDIDVSCNYFARPGKSDKTDGEQSKETKAPVIPVDPNRYQSIKVIFKENTFDITITTKYIPNDKDSLKGFSIVWPDRKVNANRSDLLLMLKSQRKYTMEGIDYKLLAYFFLEDSRNQYQINNEFTAFIKNEGNKNMIARAAALYLVKYVDSINTERYGYFVDNLFDYIVNFPKANKEQFNILKLELLVKFGKVFAAIESFYDRNINRFASCYLAFFSVVLKNIQTKELTDSHNVNFFNSALFPMGVQQYAEVLNSSETTTSKAADDFKATYTACIKNLQ